MRVHMWHRYTLLEDISRVKAIPQYSPGRTSAPPRLSGRIPGLGNKAASWYYVRAMVNKIFATISVLIYLLALGLLVFGILVMLGKVQ
jgi:hypothetical protein